MQAINAGAWRIEPDQIISGLTARLLVWMDQARLDAALETEEVAARIENGLRELMEAQAAAVLVRTLPGDDLVFFAASDAAPVSAAADDESSELPAFAARPLLTVLPHEAFFLEKAPAHLQVFVGELCDFLRAGGAVLPAEAPALVVPLPAPDAVSISGIALLWIRAADGMVPATLQPILNAVALQAGALLATAQRMSRLARFCRDLGEVLADAIDGRDARRAHHSRNVAYYAGLIAREMDLSDVQIERIEFAALLHDLGRTAVPDAILQKDTPLSPEELEAVRGSTVLGAEWMSEVEGLQELASMVRHQGERFDGDGYPDGLSGEAIPLGARILAVALRFSAMTRPRADRRAFAVVGGALDSLAQEAGTSLDPRVVNAFLAAMGRALS